MPSLVPAGQKNITLVSASNVRRDIAVANYFGQVANGYVIIPAFSITDHTTWLGASRLLAQFNYQITQPLNILTLPTKPNDTFILCIRWNDGNTVYRYKLIEDSDELLFEDLYEHQIILQNFSIEVWSTENSDPIALNPAEIQLQTSILHKLAETCINAAEVSLLEGDYEECSLYAPLPFAPPATLVFGSCSAGDDNNGTHDPPPVVDQPPWNPPNPPSLEDVFCIGVPYDLSLLEWDNNISVLGSMIGDGAGGTFELNAAFTPACRAFMCNPSTGKKLRFTFSIDYNTNGTFVAVGIASPLTASSFNGVSGGGHLDIVLEPDIPDNTMSVKIQPGISADGTIVSVTGTFTLEII